MGELIYTGITSLDGYTADEKGDFDWSAPDAEVHQFVNDLERSVGTYLYGRRMYDVMAVWETMPLDDEPPVVADYAQLWRAADKIVYSTTLGEVSTERTRVERTFDAAAVRALRESAATDISVGGAHLAAAAIEAGLVDRIRILVSPVVVGGGTAFLPRGVRIDLDLVTERRFGNGVVFVEYRVK